VLHITKIHYTMIYSFLIILFYFFHLQEVNKPVETINLTQLHSKTIRPENDTLYVINFWATWCKPCVEEIPFFEGSLTHFADKKVKILLVSLDFLSEKDKVDKFIENNTLQNIVYLFNAGDANVWIDKVDKNWNGDIPATVLYRKGQKITFHQGDFSSQKELDSLITTNIK